MRYVFLAPARAELQEAIQFYESRQPDLGREFADEVSDAVASILQHPTRWKRVFEDVRQYRLRRFPYAVVYQIRRDRIRIMAVMHLRRNPIYWRNRLLL